MTQTNFFDEPDSPSDAEVSVTEGGNSSSPAEDAPWGVDSVETNHPEVVSVALETAQLETCERRNDWRRNSIYLNRHRNP